MMTIEIKINGSIREIIDIVQVEPKTDPYGNKELQYSEQQDGWRLYLVSNTFKIKHKRQDGVRTLARLALNAVKKFKS